MRLSEDRLSEGEAVAAATFYREGGAGDVPAQNEEQWQRYAIWPRTLSGTTDPDITTEVAGVRVRLPVLAAASAWHGLWHPNAEAETARGVRIAGSLMALSQASSLPPEDVAAAGGPYLQQLYVPRDRALLSGFLERAEIAGAVAVVLTVDQLPVPSEQPFRSGLAPQRWSWQPWDFTDPGAAPADSFEPGDIAALAASTRLPVLVKGILHPGDAVLAVDAGASAVIVSNHGGRQFAGAVTPAEVLPTVVDAVGGRVPVYVDSGVRSAADVFRALCLGAQAAFVGRPVLRELEAGGAGAVARWLGSLGDDLRSIFQLAGVRTVADCHRGLLLDRGRG